jgi:hypothetical protein
MRRLENGQKSVSSVPILAELLLPSVQLWAKVGIPEVKGAV